METSRAFRISCIALIILQFMQSMESILGHFFNNIPDLFGKLHSHYPFIPVLQISETLYMFIQMILIISAIIIGSLVFLELRWAKVVGLVFSFLEILNGLIYVILTIHFKKYYPGAISSSLLILTAAVIIIAGFIYRGNHEEV